jgi:hypothetical protein
MNKFKLRFSLAKGKNYLKWKLTHPDGKVEFLEPTEVVITLDGAKLVNQKGTATKIFNGAHKEVCAWVEADSVSVHHQKPSSQLIMSTTTPKVTYNPRVTPNWVLNGENVDKEKFTRLYTIGRNLHLFIR